MTARILRCAALLIAVAVLVPGLAARSQDATDKSIFVTVADAASGKPVMDLKLGEFAIREDNIDREITGVKRATQPLFITILGDTTEQAGNTGMMSRADMASGGTELIRDIRGSLTEFARAISAASPESQMSIMEFGQAALTVSNFSSKLADVEKGINRLYPKQDADSVLLEALIDAGRNLAKKPSPRRAIVVLNIEPGDEASREEPNKVLDALRSSRASLWAVSLQKGELRNPARDVVLNRLTQITGGRREYIVGPSGLESTLKIYAEYLTSQYEVTYKRPASSAKVQAVQIGHTRAGQNLKLYANMFAPQ